MISALSRRFAAHPVTTAVPRNLALPGFRATRALNTIPKLSSQQEQRGKSWSKAPFVAIAGCVLGSAALVTASAEEQKHDAMFKSSQVQVVTVIGPPLCGKATQAQRISKYFDALPLGPEDDIFSEVALGTAGGSHLRLCILGWPRSSREAEWLEEELCPISALVYINTSPEAALKRTSDRAAFAVKSGHKLFHAISDELLESYRSKGKLIEINGDQSLDDTWKEIEKKLASALKTAK